MNEYTESDLETEHHAEQAENIVQPFVIELTEGLTVGKLLEILLKVPSSTKILCDLNELDSKSFPMTCLRYDGKRLLEITIGD